MTLKITKTRTALHADAAAAYEALRPLFALFETPLDQVEGRAVLDEAEVEIEMLRPDVAQVTVPVTVFLKGDALEAFLVAMDA